MLKLLLLLAALLPGQAQGHRAAFSARSPLLTAPVLTLLTPDEVLDLMDSGQLPEAEAAARRAALARPDSARARVVLARILARQDRWAEARKVLAQAQALPQWEEEDLSVPYESPREIDRVMQRDPEAALRLIADVLLAEGDDPKAYYLQALALVSLGEYDASQAALDRARRYGDVEAFAHPDTLRRLEVLLHERPTSPMSLESPALEPPRPLPWWLWAGVGTGAGALGWWGFAAWQRAAAQAKAERERAIFEANAQLDREIYATQTALAAEHTPELKRRLERLYQLRGQVNDWEQGGAAAPDIAWQFGALLAASQSDASWQGYQAELARQAAEEARAEAERQSRQRSDEPSSFSSGGDDSWSSGSSDSSGGNNGGSRW
ncbi:hypothetical protein GCM10017783_14720 [Deinococcus piscis]|uniref:Tetratricopeptide repeat protein n=1 Tax=Deinococcus piscis TaxID=394230 RepID=A0ABQ3K4D8_9DEIO|nr:tetratricopeptide repeat protein [Deinococcus piscis]GHG03337.1 hypothetical protein GCM10017783_14720 [Deinococcus piscis]